MFEGPFAREEELLVRLARLYSDADNDARIETLLTAVLDWNHIVILAAKNKVLQLVWDNLLQKEWLNLAIQKGGLTKLWTVYLSQLYTMNRERNRLFVTNVEELAQEFQEAGLQLIVLKGGAMIGDLYTYANRMLHDVDLLGYRQDAARIKEFFFAHGYQYGYLDHTSESIQPLAPKVERMWVFQNHTLPSFYRLCDSPFISAFKIQAGFNFFDNYDTFSFPSERVLAQARPKPGKPHVCIPAHEHMIINLCCHIYREGVSMNYADMNDNFQLTKFCDLYSYLQKYGADIDKQSLKQQVQEAKIEQPYYYALYYTHQVYGDPLLVDWLQLIEAPEDTAFLRELRDGKRSQFVDTPFHVRLFSVGRVRQQVQGGWNQYVPKDQW